MSPLVTMLMPVIAAAAPDSNPQVQLERWLYYRGMRACFDNPDFNTASGGTLGDNKTVSSGDINRGHIFNGGASKRGFGYLAPDMDGANDNDGTVSCDDGSIFVRGAKLYGFNNPMHLVCAMNRALSSGDNSRIEPSNGTDCEASEEITFDGGGGDVFQRALTKALESEGSKNRPAFNINDNGNPGQYTHQALLYLIGKNSLEVFCGNGAPLSTATGGSTASDDVVSVDVVIDGKVKASQAYAVANTNRDENSKVDDIYYNQGGSANNALDMRCHEMAKMTRDNSAAYASWADKNKDAAEDNEDTVSNGGTGASSKSETTCAIDGVGWMICPIVRIIATFNDSLFSLLEGLLGINVSMFDTNGSGKGTFQAWKAVRDIANVAFVIAFMLIVYSQLTNFGISNYGIKKMLPRIFVAAILVNLSFYICAVAVDISNIVGSSLHELLTSQTKALGNNTGSNLGEWERISDWLLAGGTAALAIGGTAVVLGPTGFLGALALLIPLAVTALVAALVVLFILIARQALVIILIVLAPLAFVAFLLPNTEQWFDRWRKIFFSMLLIYPLVALLFGGSQLAAAVIRGGADDALVYILSLAVLVLPLFATPLLLKLSGSLIGRIAGVMNNPNKGVFDRMKKGSSRYVERKRNSNLGAALARSEKIRQGSGRGLGKSNSWRRQSLARIAGVGSANSIDSEQKDTFAKASADSARRDYIVNRSLEPESNYAERIGGSEDAARYVKSYAIQAKADELEKDIKASQILYRETSKTMAKKEYSDHLEAQISSSSTPMFEKRAAMREFASVANAESVNNLANKMSELGKASEIDTLDAQGNEVKGIKKEDKAELQREFVATFKGDGRMPVNFSATNAAEAQTGDFTSDAPARITATVGGGKLSAGHFGKMDIDEMREWNKEFSANPDLLKSISADKIASVRQAIETAQKDPRINVSFGDRETKALNDMKVLLDSQQNQSLAAKADQDSTASTYGPGI
jgi:hypothetical protein